MSYYFSVSTSRMPPAVADTEVRCASFLFTSETSGWLHLVPCPGGLNSSHVSLKAAVSLSSSSGSKRWCGLAERHSRFSHSQGQAGAV